MGWGKALYLFLLAFTFAQAPVWASEEDPYLWLEEVESPAAIEFAKSLSEPTVAHFQSQKNFRRYRGEIEKIVLSKDRLAFPDIKNGYIYNFWQDATYVRGIWRRTPINEYRKKEPVWEILLDIDQLGKEEMESWVFHGSTCLGPEYVRCLIELSRGGKDASEVREFDLRTKAFVKDGFFIPEAKSRYGWIDENTLAVATDFGEGSLTKSGYPRIMKEWKRGTPLAEAKTVFEGEESDVAVSASAYRTKEGVWRVISRAMTFYEADEYLVTADGKLALLDKPKQSTIEGFARGYMFLSIQEDWTVGEHSYKAGSLLRMKIPAGGEKAADLGITELFVPTERVSFGGLTITAGKAFLTLSDNVKTKVYDFDLITGEKFLVGLPDNGTASVIDASSFHDDIFLTFQNFLEPASIYYLSGVAHNLKPERWKSLPDVFRAGDMVSEQFEAVSKDGTKVPYFIVHKKDLVLDGKNPTLLYAYGGFQQSMNPYYLGAMGKVWLERGGVYVLANIRGGGEFGPTWHQAALRENRQRAFDDFYAVAEDITRRGVTSSKHLAIRGGSNGGLLMGVAYTQRPDLFKAVICEVPLLDMLRFHKLLAGNSWVGEYGNPDVPADREFISRYSPYQNIQKGKDYPSIFFITSTKDDRVHPGHARKMAARLQEYGIPFYYFENTEGGHGAAADPKQRIEQSAMMYTYMFEQLTGGEN